MRLTGTMRIELTDVVSGEVEAIEETNMITDVVNDLFTRNPFGVFYNAGTAVAASTLDWNSKLLPICPNMLGGIVLFSTPLNEQASNVFSYSGNLPVAYASNDVNATANTKRGSMNLIESMPLSNGYKFVWEFTASQGNGTIAAAALTHAYGGRNGFGSLQGDASAFITLKDVRNSVLTHAQNLLLYEACEVDFENEVITSITYEDNSVVITTIHLPIFTIGLNERLDDSSLKVVDTETIVTATFQFVGGNTCNGQFFDGKDGYWYGFANTGNSSGNATMYWVKISKADYSISEGVWTLADVQIRDVGNQRINTTPERSCKGCLRSGYLYVMAYDRASVYKINVNNSADVTEISLGFTSEFESLGEGGSYGLYMTLIGDIIMGCDFQVLSNDKVIRTAGEQRFEHGSSPLFPYKEFLVGWGGRYGNSFRSVHLLTPYLGTINNLESAVVKTSSKTMKITYTLTETAGS